MRVELAGWAGCMYKTFTSGEQVYSSAPLKSLYAAEFECMKILCLEQFRDLGGGQLSLIDLLPGLRDRGWEPVVAIPGEGPLAERVRSLNFDIELFDAPTYTNGRKRAIDMARYAT